ncbi:MAG: biotin carboxylase N-terminal domain-containing protein [Desulfobacterales bacterium]
MEKILVANRGEIAVRIIRAAAELGLATAAVFSEDDRKCLHTRFADHSVALQGLGAAAYLDAGQIIAAARDNGCMAIAPGYGFLAENAQFARRCEQAGIAFIGPTPESLEVFGNKALAGDGGRGIRPVYSLEDPEAPLLGSRGDKLLKMTFL